MTARVVVRPAARRHIHEIADYIAADSLGASDRFIDEVYTAFDLLARMPLVGAPAAYSANR